MSIINTNTICSAYTQYHLQPRSPCLLRIQLVDNSKERRLKPVVIKRDGCQVPFDEMLIKQAVERAAHAARVYNIDYYATWPAGRYRCQALCQATYPAAQHGSCP
ncbi:MAG: ATP cone domain-containing protein [Symbiopectobacterium sp.]